MSAIYSDHIACVHVLALGVGEVDTNGNDIMEIAQWQWLI